MIEIGPTVYDANTGDPGPDGWSTARINVLGLSVSYAKRTGFWGTGVQWDRKGHQVDVPIFKDRVTALMGPSGCGKSSLLQAINRIHELYPDERRVEGRVLLDGQNILSREQDVNSVRARIGMVFQKPTPFPGSIYWNVAFGIKLWEKLPKSELDGRVEDALRRAALWDEVKERLSEPGTKLSGGQQQRLCIARAIAVNPEVLLLDEPTASLDPLAAELIEELVEKFRGKTTIAIVTHHRDQALGIADNVAFMFYGRLVEFGPTENMFVNPQTELVNNFVSGRRLTTKKQ